MTSEDQQILVSYQKEWAKTPERLLKPIPYDRLTCAHFLRRLANRPYLPPETKLTSGYATIGDLVAFVDGPPSARLENYLTFPIGIDASRWCFFCGGEGIFHQAFFYFVGCDYNCPLFDTRLPVEQLDQKIDDRQQMPGNRAIRRRSLPLKIRFRVLKRDKFTCQYCGKHPPDVELVVDHRTPVSAGGSDDDRNLVTACVPCNSGKGAELLGEVRLADH